LGFDKNSGNFAQKNSMAKILMVCLGNICRSPVAEGVMRKLIEEKGIKASVDSAGTSNYHIGEAPDQRSAKNALKNNVDISSLRARQFEVRDFDHFDHIYVMDTSNYSNVSQLARNDNDLKKVQLLLNKIYPGKDMAVPDPYYGGENGFEEVFQLIHKACTVIANELK
jgi:protein-tyrosine phosphatase